MKKIFEGRKKFISIPIVVILSLTFFPIAIGLGLGWIVYKKIGNKKLKYSVLVIIALFTLLFGGVWVSAMTSSSGAEQKQKQVILVTPTPTLTPTPTSTPALNPEVKAAAVEITKEPSSIATATLKPAESNKQEAKVVKVIDGDTINVSFNGKTETVRFIGINSPETVDPRKPVECFGEKASAVAKENLTGETIWLESDPSQSDRDKYNRLLRYVWTDEGFVDFGKVMIATGFAYEYTYDIPYKYQKEYKQAQKEAEEGKKGLWADSACPEPTIKPTAKPIQPSSNSGSDSGVCKYSCSGPDKDCPDFSTHDEAQAFFNCCGFTATNDPMKLDSVGVGDGIACESLP